MALRFKQFLESIVDVPRETVSPDIFDMSDRENPKLLPNVIEQIKIGIDKINALKPVKDYLLIGSILTTRHKDDADLDINVLVDATDEEKKKLQNILKDINGKTVEGTNHPINYFLINSIDKHKNAANKSDGVFDIKDNIFLKKSEDGDFDISIYINTFKNKVAEIESAKTELTDDIIDYEILKLYNIDSIQNIANEIEDSLKELEQSANNIVDIYNNIKGARDSDYAKELSAQEIKTYGSHNKLPSNVVYKLLERFHYLKFLKKVKDILGDDRKLSDKEADKLVDLINK